jgi:hypothetical protein
MSREKYSGGMEASGTSHTSTQVCRRWLYAYIRCACAGAVLNAAVGHDDPVDCRPFGVHTAELKVSGVCNLVYILTG